MKSQLRLLLAQKEQSERKSISLRQVSREAPAPISTVLGLANNDIDRVQLDSIANLCRYLNCTIGDLLILVDEPPTA